MWVCSAPLSAPLVGRSSTHMENDLVYKAGKKQALSTQSLTWGLETRDTLLNPVGKFKVPVAYKTSTYNINWAALADSDRGSMSVARRSSQGSRKEKRCATPFIPSSRCLSCMRATSMFLRNIFTLKCSSSSWSRSSSQSSKKRLLVRFARLSWRRAGRPTPYADARLQTWAFILSNSPTISHWKQCRAPTARGPLRTVGH